MPSTMHIFGFVGRSGSGKTTLIEKLLPALLARSFIVSTMKHTHHGFDMDRPGKDSRRHRDAGAAEVMVVSGDRWALLCEEREEVEPDVDSLVDRMRPVDLLLIEGFRAHSHPKIEVHRPSTGKDLLWQPGSDIVAVASDEPLPGVGVPVLDLDDVEAIADFVTHAASDGEARSPRAVHRRGNHRSASRRSEISANDRQVPSGGTVPGRPENFTQPFER